MIRKGIYYFPTEEGDDRPDFISKERAMRFCGCSIFVGMWMDTKELGTITRACCDEHLPEITKVHEAYGASMDGKRPDLDELPAVEAAEIVMNEAWPA